MTGNLAITFDDRHIHSWLSARPLFDEHSARVTFFIVEADLLDGPERAGIRTLLADGHSIGSHGARHRNADEIIARDGAAAYLAAEIDPSTDALHALGASAQTFAYPNSRRDDTSDAVLLSRFTHLRGGGPRATDISVAEQTISAPAAPVRVHPARGIDTGRSAQQHPADAETLSAMLRSLADNGGTLVLYAHDIATSSTANHIHPDRLRQVLHEADDLGLCLIGMDKLSEPER